MTDLKARLAALSPRTHNQAQSVQNTSSVSERMTRLRGMPKPEVVTSDDELADKLGGQCIEAGLISVEKKWPLSTQHGCTQLKNILQAPLALLNNGNAVSPQRLLFIDTETTGLAGGTGTLAFLVGLLRIEQDKLVLRQLFLTGFKGEAALLSILVEYLQQASHIVSFNGKTFDVPLLITRFQLLRMSHAFDQLHHIDLLHPTRAAFARVWDDCRLQTAERRLLRFSRTDDLPGALMPTIWSHFVRTRCIDKLDGVLEHNQWDLISLVAVMTELAFAYDVPGYIEADAHAIARAALKRRNENLALAHLELCRSSLDQAALLELARLYRRQKRWEDSVAIWSHLSEDGCVESLECLAKYHEHVQRDLHSALALSEKLVGFNSYSKHLARQARLIRKLSVAN